MIRGVAMHGSSFSLREDFLDDCGRPCNSLSCLLFSMVSLQPIYSGAGNFVGAGCCTHMFFNFFVRSCHMYTNRTMSLVWPVSPYDRFENSFSSLPPEAPGDGLRRVVLGAPERSRWRHGARLTQPQI